MTAFGQSSKENDTICLTLPEAKRLAYIKLNYKQLDSITGLQSLIIDELNKAVENRDNELKLCEEKNENLKKTNTLLIEKHKKEVEIYTRKKTFVNKVKPYLIGYILGSIIRSYTN